LPRLASGYRGASRSLMPCPCRRDSTRSTQGSRSGSACLTTIRYRRPSDCARAPWSSTARVLASKFTPAACSTSQDGNLDREELRGLLSHLHPEVRKAAPPPRATPHVHLHLMHRNVRRLNHCPGACSQTPVLEETLDMLIERATAVESVSLRLRGDKNGVVSARHVAPTVHRFDAYVQQKVRGVAACPLRWWCPGHGCAATVPISVPPLSRRRRSSTRSSTSTTQTARARWRRRSCWG